MDLSVVIAWVLVFGTLGALIAPRKGLRPVDGFALGAILGILGVAYLALRSDKAPQASQPPQAWGTTTRIQEYGGASPAAAEAAFRTDAEHASRAGWRPISQEWTSNSLRVTYEQVQAAQTSPTPSLTPATVEPRSERMSPMLVAGVALVAIAIGGTAGMAMLGIGPFAGPRTVPLEDIKPYVPAGQLGSWYRDEVIERLTGLGFIGDTEPGEPWQGEYGSHSATVNSDSESLRVEDITVIMAVPDDDDDTIEDVARITASLLNAYAPDSSDFVSDQIRVLSAGGEGTSRVFGDTEVGVYGMVASDGMVVILGFEPA